MAFCHWATWAMPIDVNPGAPGARAPQYFAKGAHPLFAPPPIIGCNRPQSSKCINLPKQKSSRYAGLYFYMHACQSVMKDMLFCSNCPKFGQLIFRKIFRNVATRCQILRLEGTKFDFSFGWGSAPDPAQRSPRPPICI